MEGSALLHLPEGMLIEQIHITENGLVIEVVATHPQSCCPLCSQTSSSIHSHYRRNLLDACDLPHIVSNWQNHNLSYTLPEKPL